MSAASLIRKPSYMPFHISEKFRLIIQCLALASLFGSAYASSAPTDETSVEDGDKMKLIVGAFVVSNSSATIRADRVVSGVINVGTSLDWSRDLKGDTTMTVPRLVGYYRFTPKSRIDFGWYKISRRGQVVLAKDIDFNDIHFSANETVASRFDTETYKASYTYSFYRTPEIEVALSAGLHVSKLFISINTSSGGKSESTSITAPLPVMGFIMNYNITPKWQVATKYELFFLEDVDKYSGSLSDFVVTVEHQTFKHIKFGAGFNRLETNLTVQTSDRSAETHSVLNGFLLYTAMNY